ncbi:MAG TPA: NAD-dependent epimerase/dehydratase family protein [Polyangiaceae bacterium]|jgi:dihydroflavonol-4-reductase|nr:NAD-dependent epimerase/dehydratase family protein [Polyangiaceae bacterium]
MRFLVTGATGFLGTHLSTLIEGRGHDVVRYSRGGGAGEGDDRASRHHVRGDVLDGDRVLAAAKGCDGAFHCAGNVSRKPEDAAALYRVHVEGTKVVVGACAEAGLARVVIASSSGTIAVTEDDQRASTEESPVPLGIIGRWPYYRAKLFAEQAALARGARSADFSVVSVNPSLLLGPGDVNGSSTADVRAFLDGRIVAVPRGGVSFVDVRDVADAMFAAMERGRSGERYLLGGCNLTVREFFDRLARISGVPAPLVTVPGLPRLPNVPGLSALSGAGTSREWIRAGAQWIDRVASRIGVPSPVDPVAADMAQFYWYVDSSKAARELGFRPRDPNVTLHETVADLRDRGVVWPRDTASTS